MGRGLCSACYQRLKRAGRLGEYSRDKKSFETRLAEIRGAEGECWTFPLAPNSSGYASTYLDGAHLGAHVASFVHHHGPVPDDMQVGHLCHDGDASCIAGVGCLHRRCVNPDHLALLTPAENTQAAAHRLPRCPNGHPWTIANSRWHGGQRKCRRCATERMRQVRSTDEGRALHNQRSRESYRRRLATDEGREEYNRRNREQYRAGRSAR